MAIKNRKRLSTSLIYEHFEFLTEICDKNKQKQSVIIERGLELLNNSKHLPSDKKPVTKIKKTDFKKWAPVDSNGEVPVEEQIHIY